MHATVWASGLLRIDPERIRFDWVADTDVSGGAFTETAASKHSKGACHVLQLPLALLVWVGNLGDARKLVTSSSNGGKSVWDLLLGRLRGKRAQRDPLLLCYCGEGHGVGV